MVRRHGEATAAEASSLELVLSFLYPFVLFGMPRASLRIVGVPVYFTDVLVLLLLGMALGLPEPPAGRSKWVRRASLLFLVSVLLSEFHGAFAYGLFLEPIYYTARYFLAISLVAVLPRLFSRRGVPASFLIGVSAGVLLTAALTIGTSLPFSRGFVMSNMIGNSLLNPVAGSDRRIELLLERWSQQTAIRGSSLVGVATITAGFLGVGWPLAVIAASGLVPRGTPRILGTASAILAPFGLLATYGRAGWAMVIVGLATMGAVGSQGGRRVAVGVTLLAGMVLGVFGEDTEVTMVDRVINRTRVAIDKPFEGGSERERLMSYYEPLVFLIDNPEWLIVGAGRTGNRMERASRGFEQMYDEHTLATHSGFAVSVYAFGAPGLVSQLWFLGAMYLLVLGHIYQPLQRGSSYLFFWQVGFAGLNCYVVWWLAGHAPVGAPRGVFVSFTLAGLFCAADSAALAGRKARP